MKAKKFSLLIILVYVAATILLFGIILFITKDYSKYSWKEGVIYPKNSLTVRQEKTNYISQKNQTYNAFIIGGSKAAALQPETFSLYEDINIYNFSVPAGNFRDYSLYINYLLDIYDGNVKEIILHLSSHEVEDFSRVPYIPVQMQKNPIEKLNSILKKIQESYLNINTIIAYKNNKQKNIFVYTKNGSRSRENDMHRKNELKNEKVFNTFVLSYWGDYKLAIRDLFYNTRMLAACDKNIEELKNIKSICDKKNVKLTIIIGPTFIAELYKYASPQYVKYLKDMVSIQSVWNFSGINDVNLNPYNFYNGGHYYIFVADKMIEKIYESIPNTTDMDAFGILLTKDNIDTYIESQIQKWNNLKTEYESTGTIKLYGKDAPSYLDSLLTD